MVEKGLKKIGDMQFLDTLHVKADTYLGVHQPSFSTLFRFSQGELRVGFYSRTCPQAESIVSSVVREATLSNPRTPALLLRMQFHDCMVEGCDGSILIDNGNAGERMATGNQGLGGFDVIDKAKAMLERVCKGVVSCSDIVALAARDAVFLRNGPFYQVPTGRRDGRVSDISHAANIPEAGDSIQLLKSKFRQKGLSDRDLVLLSAAHTIGTTACFFIETRLYNFTRGGGSDPAIDPDFLPKLKAKCPFRGDINVRLPLDPVTEETFDVQILRNIRDGLAVIESDARLYDDRATKRVVDSYIGQRGSSAFGQDFAEAMVKMGNIGVKTGSQGEIRRICTAVNGVPL
ncbi:peroxidase 43-like [Vitis riparia]|uniref:peroxidase 43-like n=1 Tax=Vitis riparia TaxID=96939 RepID=UPI00155A26A8|nr:peroxidase 43-like [Vitis riparia]